MQSDETQMGALRYEIQKLQAENIGLRQEITTVKRQLSRSEEVVVDLRDDNVALTAELELHKASIKAATSYIQAQGQFVELYLEKVQKMTKTVDELQASLDDIR